MWEEIELLKDHTNIAAQILGTVRDFASMDRDHAFLMQLQPVDAADNGGFPDPDGPQITMRSPDSTLKFMSFNTWKSPNHLFTPTISIRSSAIGGPIGVTQC